MNSCGLCNVFESCTNILISGVHTKKTGHLNMMHSSSAVSIVCVQVYRYR